MTALIMAPWLSSLSSVMKPEKAILAIALAALAVAASAALSRPSVAAAAHDVARPNVILIVSDDQSFDSVVKMPYLRSRDPAYGGGWFRFDNAFINNPTCCPSRATILTGQWSHHTGVEATGGAPRFDDSDTLATRLDAADYRTGFIGKYHLGSTAPISSTYMPPGWDEFIDHKAQTPPYYEYTLNDNGELVDYGSDPEDYATDVLANKALDFLNRNAGAEPFFLTLAPRAPHNGWTAAPRHLGHYANEPVTFPPSFNEDTSDKPAWWAARQPVGVNNQVGALRKQWDTLLALDDAVEAIHRRVRDLGLMDRTVILYMTDNGYSFGEHRWGEKRCVYDSCTHTPLYVKFGGHSQGWTFPQPVGNEDLSPTFADLTGAQPPAGGDGQSFASLLRSNQTPAGWDDAVLLRSFNNNDSDQGHPPTEWAIRTPTYMYGELVHTPEVELYDLMADPYQLQNVATDPAYAAVRAELAARLAQMRGP